MWSPLVICLALGLATAEYAWKPGTEYKYEISGRTLAALHQVSDKYVGVVSRAILSIQPKTPNTVYARIYDAQYSQVHAPLPGGWTSRIPEKETNFKPLPLSSKPFEIHFKNGVVDELVLSKNLPTAEVNLLKSVVSQLQVDTQGVYEIKQRTSSQVPNLDAQKSVYSTMEDTVTGKCEVMYDISPLPEYAIQSMPALAPVKSLRSDGHFYDIVKTKNFSNCEKRVAYHYGFSELTDWEPADNRMDHFLSRSSVSRIVISGSLSKYTIQSSVTTARIILSPALYDAQKGMVGTRMNVTLLSARPASGSYPAIANPRTVKDLVYEYNTAFPSEHGPHTQTEASSESNSSSSNDSADSESDSENSTSESSEENQEKRAVPKRFRRSAPKKKYDSSGSSSSSSEADSDDSVSNGGSSSSSDSSESASGSGASARSSASSRSGSGSSESSSSSSSSEEHQPKPTMNKPPQFPFLPYFIGHQGSSVQAAKDLNVVSAVKKLCSQIAAELQNPSSMPQKGTLEKFSIVVRLVRTMSTEQLRKVTSEIYAPIKSTSGENPWPVLRDAVATAGTGPALIAAKEWIMTKKIYGEEAAEVLATLPRSARTPTPEYINTFFTLSTSPDVTKQHFLNTTAILAFTNLVRMAQVNNVTAHNYYGVHAFGRFSPIDHKDISERYIPYLAKELRSAVKYGDSHSIQVYIRALGNLAHPKILRIFEPYLEGKEQMSTFQRTLMVASLNKLARTYPKVARRVLFNVYQNTAEAHEVRCAAVFVLMRTGPPAFMLQRMAEFTNKDISQQVSSAVKSAIQSAAALEGPHHQELKKNAAAAVHLLTPKHFGFQYSNSYLKSYMVKEMGLAHKQELSYIGSSDSFLPSSLFLSSRQNIGGWKTEHMALGIMTSSIDDIADAVSDRFDYPYSSSRGSHGTRGRTSSRSQSPYTTDTIAEMLNVQPVESEQVEGNFHFHTMGTERLITFDNTTLNYIPHALKEAASALRSGHRFYYSKLYNRFALTLSFATETGLPFVYTLKCPTYMSIRGEVKAKTHPDMADGSHSQLKMPQTVNASASLHFVYSSRLAAKISFVAPLTHQRYIAGLDKNVQVNLPVHADFSLDAENARANLTLQSLYNSRDSLLFHYSTWPYTTKHNILDLNPVSQGSDHKIIHVREPHKWENTFGKDATGFAFRVKYMTEQKYVDTKWLWEKAYSYDALSFLLYPCTEYTIKYNDVNVYFDAHKSSSKSVTFTADYSNNTYHVGESYSDESFEQNSASHEREDDHKSHSGARTSSAMASPSTSAPISEKRQKEFLKKASSGIRNSSTSVLDLAVVFNGEKYVSYVATAAYANSEVDETSRFLFYYHKSPQYSQPNPFEVCLAYEGKWPKVPLMNYAKALKAKPTSYSSFEIAFGETCRSSASQISIKGKAEQTSERKEYVRRSPLSQLCMSQMQHGDYLLPACRNVTAHANFLDSYSYEIEYDKLPAAFKNYTYKAYSLARYFAFPYLDEKIVDVHNKDGKVTIDLYFDEDLHAANVSLSTPYLDAKFNRVRVSPMFRPIAVQHPTYSATKRFFSVYSGFNYPATCSIESKSFSTFDNTTYAAQLGKCWHVIMSTKPTESYSSSSFSSQYYKDVAILARDVSDKKKEFKIVLGENVFEIKPAGSSGSGETSESSDPAAYVLYNQQPQPVSHRNVSQIRDDYGQTYAKWWALPCGPVIFVAPKHGVVIYYNGYGAKIMASSYHKNDVFGLCGTYTGEPSTDFTSPRNCILRYPGEFVASYALPDQTCQGDAKEMQRRAASAPCFRQTATPYEVISGEDYSTGYRSHSDSKYNSFSRKETSSSSCTQSRIMIIEEGSHTCFSTRPLPACASKCRPAGKIEQTVPMHCVANSDASRHYVQMVKKGANPDFSRKEVTKKVTISLPKSCTQE